MNFNICTATDSYKLTHWNQYPHDTEKVYSYLEARKGARFDETVFFGLQYIMKRYLEGVVVTTKMVDQAEKLAAAHFGNPDIFNRERWDYIVRNFGGRLPVRIKAVPEGMPVPINNVMMTIENTDPKCYWLTNHLETILTHVWSPSTVATQSRRAKKVIKHYLDKTAQSDAGLDFMLHDFGYRGVSSIESAALSGAGHLVNFKGTDTIAAMELLMQYYGAEVPAFSVPATEHSVMTSQGQEGEEKVLEQVLTAYPAGILSVVIDSYDYRNFIKLAGTKYKYQISRRDGKVVFRPDSGNPIAVTKEVLTLLAAHFGSTRNDKGYITLDPKVGALWGDGINLMDMTNILDAMAKANWSADNIVFGMGGGLLQKINRDTQRFAFKSSYQERNGIGYDIFKDPVDSSKASKRGRLKLVRTGDTMTTLREEEPGEDLMQIVFENGDVKKSYTLDEVRDNATLRENLFAGVI
jgi:nicotinamide phosphoribosyltransferase